MGKGSGGGSAAAPPTINNPQPTLTQAAPSPQIGQAYTDLMNRATGVANQPLQQYSGPLVAGFNPQQQAAFGGINQYANFAQPYFQQGASYASQAAAPVLPGLAADTSQLMSPYLNTAVGNTAAQLSNINRQQQEQLVGQAIGAGAYGGDRAGVAAAELANQQSLAAGQVLGQMENQGYQTAQQTALNAATSDAWRQANAGYELGGLGAQAQQAGLAGASAQLQAGGLQQQLAQEQLNIPFEQFQQQQAYPFQTTGWLASLLEGVGGGLGGTSLTEVPGANVAGQIGGLGLAGLGALGASGAFGQNGWITNGGARRGGRIAKAGGGDLGSGDMSDLITASLVPRIVSYVPDPLGTGGGGSSLSPGTAPAAGAGGANGVNGGNSLFGDVASGVSLGKDLKDWFGGPSSNLTNFVEPNGASGLLDGASAADYAVTGSSALDVGAAAGGLGDAASVIASNPELLALIAKRGGRITHDRIHKDMGGGLGGNFASDPTNLPSVTIPNPAGEFSFLGYGFPGYVPGPIATGQPGLESAAWSTPTASPPPPTNADPMGFHGMTPGGMYMGAPFQYTPTGGARTGGRIARQVGGLAPPSLSAMANPAVGQMMQRYAALPLDKLEQLAVMQPTNPMAQRALAAKRMNPGFGQQPQQPAGLGMAPTSVPTAQLQGLGAAAFGGAVTPGDVGAGYAEGGSVDDDGVHETLDPDADLDARLRPPPVEQGGEAPPLPRVAHRMGLPGSRWNPRVAQDVPAAPDAGVAASPRDPDVSAQAREDIAAHGEADNPPDVDAGVSAEPSPRVAHRPGTDLTRVPWPTPARDVSAAEQAVPQRPGLSALERWRAGAPTLTDQDIASGAAGIPNAQPITAWAQQQRNAQPGGLAAEMLDEHASKGVTMPPPRDDTRAAGQEIAGGEFGGAPMAPPTDTPAAAPTIAKTKAPPSAAPSTTAHPTPDIAVTTHPRAAPPQRGLAAAPEPTGPTDKPGLAATPKPDQTPPSAKTDTTKTAGAEDAAEAASLKAPTSHRNPWLTLMAAGAGMMTSSSPNLLGAVGQGIGTGFRQAAAQQTADEKADTLHRQMLRDKRQFDVQEKHYQMLHEQALQAAADRAADRTEMRRIQQQNADTTARHEADQAKYWGALIASRNEGQDKAQLVAGEGYDESGNVVKGSYVWDPIKRTTEFRPGVVLRPRDTTGSTEHLARGLVAEREEMRKKDPSLPPLTLQDATAIAHRAPNADAQTLRLESLAQSAAKAKAAEGKVSFDQALGESRRFYGLPDTVSLSNQPGRPAASATAPQFTQAQPFVPKGQTPAELQAQVDNFKKTAPPGSWIRDPVSGKLFQKAPSTP